MSKEKKSNEKLSEKTQESDFSVPNSEDCKTKFKSKNMKGGPYSQKDRDTRIDEVCRLHFEYGYSAKKISELMRVNRNTVNSDIKQLYLVLEENWKETSSVSFLQNHIESAFAQKRRLREELDNTEKILEKLAIEKMILKVDSKINELQLRNTKYQFYKPTSRI